MLKRCFIAYELSGAVCETIVAIQQKLPLDNPGLSGARYIHPEQFHITLHFLGDLDEQKIQVVQDVLQHAITQTTALKLELGKFDAFPNVNAALVLILTLAGSEFSLATTLHAQLAHALQAAGLPFDQRPWKPHITLARLRYPQPVTLKTLPMAEPFGITHVSLMESRLTPAGPEYLPIKRFTLPTV